MYSQSPNPFESEFEFEEFLAEARRPRRVLLIDDDIPFHELIRHALKGFNCDLFPAFGGQQGIEMFSAVKPDLVWLDYKLEHSAIDGVDVFTEIRQQERQQGPDYQPTPVIFVSGYLDAPMIERIHAVGVALLLRKPDDFSGPKLREALRHFHIQPRRRK